MSKSCSFPKTALSRSVMLASVVVSGTLIAPNLGRVDKRDSQISVSMIQDCLSRGGRIGARRSEHCGMGDNFTVVAA